MTYNSLIYFLTPKYIICYTNAWQALSFTSTLTPYEAFVTLIVANDLINNWAQMTSLFLNIFLCYDLIQTLQSPFSVTRGRMKYYVSISVAVATASIIYIFLKQDLPQLEFFEQ